MRLSNPKIQIASCSKEKFYQRDPNASSDAIRPQKNNHSKTRELIASWTIDVSGVFEEFQKFFEQFCFGGYSQKGSSSSEACAKAGAEAYRQDAGFQVFVQRQFRGDCQASFEESSENLRVYEAHPSVKGKRGCDNDRPSFEGQY